MPARLHSALMRTTSISVSTSAGSGPKRSMSSAAKPSISTLRSSPHSRR